MRSTAKSSWQSIPCFFGWSAWLQLILIFSKHLLGIVTPDKPVRHQSVTIHTSFRSPLIGLQNKEYMFWFYAIFRNLENHAKADLASSLMVQWFWTTPLFKQKYNGFSCYLPVFSPSLLALIMMRLNYSLPTSLSNVSLCYPPSARTFRIESKNFFTLSSVRVSLKQNPIIVYSTPSISQFVMAGGNIFPFPSAI